MYCFDILFICHYWATYVTHNSVLIQALRTRGEHGPDYGKTKTNPLSTVLEKLEPILLNTDWISLGPRIHIFK